MTSPNPQPQTETEQLTQRKRPGLIVLGILIVAVLVFATVIATRMVSWRDFENEQAAKPAETVAAQMDPATVVTAPTKCGDDTIYSLPAKGGAASVLVDSDWAEIKSGEATVGFSATYAPDGQVGDIIVATKPGSDTKAVKVTSVYVWSAAMSDFKAKLNVTRFKPTEPKSSVRMKAADLTSFGPDSHLMVCTTTK